MSEALCHCGHAKNKHTEFLPRNGCRGKHVSDNGEHSWGCTCLTFTPPPTREQIRLTADDLTRLRDVAEAATPGPWDLVGDVERGFDVVKESLPDSTIIYAECEQADAEFIATFDPPTVAALIDRVERAERERDRLAESIRQLHRSSPGVMWSGLICVACSDEDSEVMYPCQSVRLLTEGADDGQ